LAPIVVTIMAMTMLGEAPEGHRPVLLTTDCGASVDDQWALVHLALSPEVELKGVITTHAPNLGEDSAETTAKAARELLGRVAAKGAPPVLAGSSVPLADTAHPRDNPGVSFLIEQARRHDNRNRLTIVVIGAATDVASALLIDPSLGDRVAIVAMGFDSWPEGKDVWNVKNDVRAWQVLLGSRVPIVVGDSAVTGLHLQMTPARAHRLLDDRNEPGPALASDLQAWLARNAGLAASATGSAEAWPIWDEVTIAHLLGLTRTTSHPRPSLRDDLTFDHARPRGTIEWITAIDSDRLWADLAAKLGPAGAQPARSDY
jgi:purine nucleosidase